MPETRHIDDVVIQIVALIPETDTDLIRKIKEFDKDLWNQSPELRNDRMFWKALTRTLQENITDIDTTWKEKIVKVFNGIE
jgi:hypothetical protein